MTHPRATGCLADDFVRACRRRRSRLKVADSTGAELTGGALLARTLVLRRLLQREVLAKDEQMVGLLMPPSVGGAVVNVALTLDRRVAVNLNYTLSSDVLNACIDTAGIRTVLTTRKVMSKLPIELEAEVVFVDELRDRIGLTDKVVGAFQAYAMPRGLLTRLLGAGRTKPDDVLTLVFTSGSTGTPKGVMLTHENVSSNVAAIADLVDLTSKDVFLGVLPFFHSFGYTATLWTTMTLDVAAAYHYNPLDGRQVGRLCERYGVTIIQATPTFLRHYLRRCKPEQLGTVDVVVTGAEKLPDSLADEFEKKLGTRPVEAYGATELSPLISCNVPPSRTREAGGDRKSGTVGRPALRVQARSVNLETGASLPVGEVGMLCVTGPNVMKGYYGRPDLTAEVLREGWYVTGDLGSIDEEGFVRIEGRLSRFSKIGGEMVPHIGLEETLNRLLGATEDGDLRAAVTAVPDAKKGERLVVVHTPMEEDPRSLCEALAKEGLPNLYIPSPDSWIEVPAIPVLGTGKLALRDIRRVALEHVAQGGRGDATEIPTMAERLPDLTGFLEALGADVRAGTLSSPAEFAHRCRQFYTPQRMAEIEAVVPGWCHMSSFEDGQTLRHVTAAMVALVDLEEYRRASPGERTTLEWVVLLHDVAKEAVRGRDHGHAFRSAALAGRILPTLSYPVTAAYSSEFEPWFDLTEGAVRFDDRLGVEIADNAELPAILEGAERIFAEPTRTAVAVIALHLSITTVSAWPAASPLTDGEVRALVDDRIRPPLLVMMLADTGGWNLLDHPKLETMYEETRAVFRRLPSPPAPERWR